MCRDNGRCSRNIAINVVLQCTFCVNFSRFNMAALQKFSCCQMTDPVSLGQPYFVLVASRPITSREKDIQKWIWTRLISDVFFSPLRLWITRTVSYRVTPLIINFVIKLCQKLITKLQASYILYTYSAFTTCRQFRTVFLCIGAFGQPSQDMLKLTHR